MMRRTRSIAADRLQDECSRPKKRRSTGGEEVALKEPASFVLSRLGAQGQTSGKTRALEQELFSRFAGTSRLEMRRVKPLPKKEISTVHLFVEKRNFFNLRYLENAKSRQVAVPFAKMKVLQVDHPTVCGHRQQSSCFPEKHLWEAQVLHRFRGKILTIFLASWQRNFTVKCRREVLKIMAKICAVSAFFRMIPYFGLLREGCVS